MAQAGTGNKHCPVYRKQRLYDNGELWRGKVVLRECGEGTGESKNGNTEAVLVGNRTYSSKLGTNISFDDIKTT